MLDELANQAANQENQQREPNVISQPSVRGPSKRRAPPFFNSPARPAVAENDGFDALKKALEAREAKEKAEAEKAAATAKKISAEVEEEEEEEEPQPEVDDGFARLRAELEKREKREKEQKKKSEPSRSGWAFIGKRKEPEKEEEEEEPLDGDDEEEENDSDIIPTQQIGGDDDDDDIEDKDAIDSQQREKRGRFFNLFGNKTPSVSRNPVKQPSPRPSPPRREIVRISSPQEDDDDFDDGPFQIPDDDNDDDDDQQFVIVPAVVQQQESPPKPRQPNQRVQPVAEQQQQQYQQRYQNRPAQPAERRRTGKFTEEEVRAIIRGVETHGSGNWKVIREQSLDGILLGRTPVDLKDKYRNLQSSDLKRVLSGILPRSGSYPFVEEHFERVRREQEERDN